MTLSLREERMGSHCGVSILSSNVIRISGPAGATNATSGPNPNSSQEERVMAAKALPVRARRGQTPLSVDLVAYFAEAAPRRWGGGTNAERFRRSCTWSGDCLLCSERTDRDGYPMVQVCVGEQHTLRRASHVSLALEGRAVPPGHQVNHHCDNRLCVNPAHLFIGTQADNVKDMMAKGRHAHGEQHTISLLSNEAVQDIRANCTQRGQPKEFAAKYGVSVSTIYAVRCGQNWRHVGA